MEKSVDFKLEMVYTDEEGNETPVVVTGTLVPYTPAKLTGDPDNWSPAEGGELEDFLAVRVADGEEMDNQEAIQEALEDKILETMEERG